MPALPAYAITSPTIENICTQTQQQIQRLLAEIDRGSNPIHDSAGEIEEVRMLLGSLPLNTDEFGQASNRFRNTLKYLCTQELGAARYELRLLLGCLTSDRHHRAGRARRKNAIPS